MNIETWVYKDGMWGKRSPEYESAVEISHPMYVKDEAGKMMVLTDSCPGGKAV